MRTSERAPLLSAVAGLACLVATTGAMAFDGVPSTRSLSPGEAFRQGTRAMQAGDSRTAFAAFLEAARRGHTPSQWRVGRILRDGADGVERNDLEAFTWFSRIVERHVDDDPASPRAQITSRAFVELGIIYLDGIPGTDVRQDYGQAWRMFFHAASMYADSEAQYRLARMYLAGTGVEKNPRLAANWLRNAAEKGHRPAQARLGEMMFTGAGMQRRPVEGLTMLSIARHGADPDVDGWIVTAFEEAFTLATDEERTAAAREVRRQLRPAGDATGVSGLPDRIR